MLWDYLSRGKLKTRRRVYLDAASTTPVDPRVLKAMQPYWVSMFGNPGAIYKEGKEANEALRTARTSVARVLSVRPEEITFLSGGTEANNLAIFGTVRSYEKEGRSASSLHVISTQLEHSSVKECLHELERQGVKVSYVPVDKDGVLDLKTFEGMLSEKTVLISIHLVNNEIGVIQPLRDISRILDRVYKDRTDRPRLHTDASQAPLFLNCSPERLGVDLLTLDSQKIYGPKGIGALFHSRHLKLEPLLLGGGQESGLRSGTEPLPLVAGFAKALELASNEREENSARMLKLRDYFIDLLTKAIPKLEINGSLDKRIPNNINISLPGVDTEFLTIHLDHMGVAVSTKSTCLTNEVGSYVVEALNKGTSYAQSTLRMTLPLTIKKRDLRVAARAIRRALQKLDTQ